MKLSYLLLGCLPSPIQVAVRRALGARIARGARISMGTYLEAKDLELGENARVGPFAFVRGNEVSIGANARIKPLSVVSTHTVTLGEQAEIAPLAVVLGSMDASSRLALGDHSRIFPFCWIEPGEGVDIGKHVGVGGHTLIFTHGSWSNHLDGGPVSFGPVRIEDNVWLPWRVMVLPKVTIGKDSIIGAHSLVNRSLPANSLAAGVPATVVRTDAIKVLSPEERTQRARGILERFAATSLTDARMDAEGLHFEHSILLDSPEHARAGDLVLFVNRAVDPAIAARLEQQHISFIDHGAKTLSTGTNLPYVVDFTLFLRKYGVRLYTNRRTDARATLS